MKSYEVAGQTFRTRKAAIAEAWLQERPLIKVVEYDEVINYIDVPPQPVPASIVPAPVHPLRALQDAILQEAGRLDYSMHTVIFPGVAHNITLGNLASAVYPEWESDLRTLLTSLQGRVYNPNILR